MNGELNLVGGGWWVVSCGCGGGGSRGTERQDIGIDRDSDHEAQIGGSISLRGREVRGRVSLLS